ncbi:nitrate- and nitrite sensing domain-containing protein [Streptomyces monticola]|uniref:Signal transduction histidine-protein kinase/phosphatase MprB n=1 Tax=Streptomyces monticola TaxID=2666263 RepID=A0ABW2JHA1_9ACTN
MRAPVQMKRPRGNGGSGNSRPESAAGAAPEGRSEGTDGAGAESAGTAGAGTAVAGTAGVAHGSRPHDSRPHGSRPDDTGSPAGRPARVRNRLIIAVAVVAATVVGAGAPAIAGASSQLAETQRLVTLSELTKNAVSLAHSLADERDEVTSYIAAGRPRGHGLAESRSGRVDRQISEVRAEAPAGLRRDLAAIADVRRSALAGKGTALDAHKAYTDAIGELHALVEDLAERLPPRAGSGARALADLDRAVEQAGAARGLLLAALATPRDAVPPVDPVTGLPRSTGTGANSRSRNDLVAAAQQARVSEQAARADFERAAPAADRAKLSSTVTGPEVATAERYLARLTDQPTLSAAELRYDRARIDAVLSARVEQLRSVENTLGADRIEHLSLLRDDDVTALELRIALVGVLLLVAVGVSMGVARTLTRPLAVLRIGSARLAEHPAEEEPVRFTGRNDEFAAVVRSVNALHAHALRLQDRLGVLEGDRKHLVGQREQLADEREELREQLTEALAEVERAGRGTSATYVQLALRTLALVERQLAVIESLEEREQDPDRLATLFKLDHFATVMRRHSENLLVLAGAEHRGSQPGPVPLVDVLRAAVSEIDRYERVRIASLPPHAHIAGFAADDISHLVAELLENATSFSPPDASAEVSGWLLESGEVMLSVQDEGIGMTAERLRELNSRLTDFDPEQTYAGPEGEGAEGLGLGLYVVARLAARHGARVQLREQKQGGVAAVVVLPKPILAAAPVAAVAPQRSAPVAGGAPAVHLPGSEAEANSNVLSGRSRESGNGADPFISAAERAVAATEAGEGVDDVDGADDVEAETAPEPEAVEEPGLELESSLEFGTKPSSEAGAESGAGAETKPDPAPESESESESESTLELAVSETDLLADQSPAPAAREAEADADPNLEAGTAPEPEADPDPEPEADPDPEPEAGTAPEPEAGSGPSPVPAPTSAPDPLLTSAPDPLLTSAPDPFPTPDPDPLPAPIPDSVPVAEPEDSHERAGDGEGESRPPKWERVTDKGLPKRTPKIAAPAPAPAQRKGSVDADALRRRLGGFHQGAQAGRRDVAAELEADTAEETAATPAADRTDRTDQGDSVEEARS